MHLDKLHLSLLQDAATATLSTDLSVKRCVPLPTAQVEGRTISSLERLSLRVSVMPLSSRLER